MSDLRPVLEMKVEQLEAHQKRMYDLLEKLEETLQLSGRALNTVHLVRASKAIATFLEESSDE